MPESVVGEWAAGSVSRQGIGRPLTVGKEELAGLLRALEAFQAGDHEARHADWRDRATRVGDALSSLDGVSADVTSGLKVSVAPK